MKILTMKLLYGLSQNPIILSFALFLAIHSISNIGLIIPKRSITGILRITFLLRKYSWMGKRYTRLIYLHYIQKMVLFLGGGPSKVIGPHPPSFYLFFAPMTKLSRNRAYILWVIVKIISICGILILTILWFGAIERKMDNTWTTIQIILDGIAIQSLKNKH